MIPLIILAIESPEDREYMTMLYLEHEHLMYWEVNKYIKNPDDANDILQTVLEKLIHKLQDLQKKEPKRRSAYIMAVCRNTSINFLKRSNRIAEFEFEFQEQDDVDPNGNTPEDFVVRKEEYRILYAAWKTLDSKSIYLLDARYILEKPVKEIAEDLGISPNHVRTALSRARKKLKKKYELKAQQPANL